jgi:prepilin-type processing-associated H-X9-DG protein
MFCQKCGAQNPDDANTCNSCGSVLIDTSESSPAKPKTSGLAVAALVLGILSPLTCLITSLPAVICGIISLIKISAAKGRLKGIGLAITGIALPIIVLPLFGMAIFLLMPSFSKVKHIAQRQVCSVNMKSLSIAIMVYANDYDGRFPTADKWCDLLIEHADVSEMSLRCPVSPESGFSFAFNKNLDGLTTESVGMDVVMIFESEPGINMTGGSQLVKTNRHPASDKASFGGCNIGFADGRVEFVNADRISKLKWIPADN